MPACASNFVKIFIQNPSKVYLSSPRALWILSTPPTYKLFPGDPPEVNAVPLGYLGHSTTNHQGLLQNYGWFCYFKYVIKNVLYLHNLCDKFSVAFKKGHFKIPDGDLVFKPSAYGF